MSATVNTKWVNSFALALVAGAIALLAIKHFENSNGQVKLRLLNVSYDPTRELYAELNPKFIAQYRKDTGNLIAIEQSHGGSSRQARAVADGSEPADVVTLALPSDIESLHARGLTTDNWQQRFPHVSQPYYSTIVFVVRKGNPKNIKDWPDLAAPGVEVVTPNPKTSGNGKLSVLAALGSVIYRGGTKDQARDLVTKLFQNVAVLGTGARDSTNTFELGGEGDVHLTWENEAIREVAESKGELQIVYPPVSIRAEPTVAVVDANVAKHKTEATAAAYLTYLFSDEAQEIFAKDGYRPINDNILKEHQDTLPDIALFPVTLIAKDWDDAQARFFGDNGIFTVIQLSKNN
ncbi:MAG: sulfate ABC transporter substrate-binding protein [Methylocella sp.]